MSVSKKYIAEGWSDPDEIPDLSTENWAKVIDAAPVQRGRPKAAATKISTTIRLDPEVINAFKREGSGWQSRMNEALRKAAGLPASKKPADKPIG